MPKLRYGLWVLMASVWTRAMGRGKCGELFKLYSLQHRGIYLSPKNCNDLALNFCGISHHYSRVLSIWTFWVLKASLNSLTTLNMIFSVVTTLSYSTLLFNSLIISVRHKCATTFPTATSFLLLSLLGFFHILTNTEFVHVTFTYYHSWYLVFEFTFSVTYFHRISDF